MLSKPNVSEIMPKVGNRYEVALAIAKRARDIEKKRTIENSSDIRDAVDIASKEIAYEEVYVKKQGEYVIKKEETKEDVKDVKVPEDVVKE